jgi:hypothetical protein
LGHQQGEIKSQRPQLRVCLVSRRRAFHFMFVTMLQRGRPSAASREGSPSSIPTIPNSLFTVQHTARADHAKEGLCTKEVVQNVISLRDGTED